MRAVEVESLGITPFPELDKKKVLLQPDEPGRPSDQPIRVDNIDLHWDYSRAPGRTGQFVDSHKGRVTRRKSSHTGIRQLRRRDPNSDEEARLNVKTDRYRTGTTLRFEVQTYPRTRLIDGVVTNLRTTAPRELTPSHNVHNLKK